MRLFQFYSDSLIMISLIIHLTLCLRPSLKMNRIYHMENTKHKHIFRCLFPLKKSLKSNILVKHNRCAIAIASIVRQVGLQHNVDFVFAIVYSSAHKIKQNSLVRKTKLYSLMAL